MIGYIIWSLTHSEQTGIAVDAGEMLTWQAQNVLEIMIWLSQQTHCIVSLFRASNDLNLPSFFVYSNELRNSGVSIFLQKNKERRGYQNKKKESPA